MRLPRRLTRTCLVALWWSASSQPARSEWAAQVQRREAIKAAFVYNYETYQRYAFEYDYLKPIAQRGEDDETLAGFGGTIVDAMSTMHVMNLTSDEQDSMYKRAMDHVRRTKFTQTYQGKPAGTVSVFEITIRYLGGMLSAFQLGGEREQDRFLVDQSARLANGLTKAWSWGTRIPFSKVNLNTGVPVPNAKEITSLADAGTLTMEWHMLSRYTANATYLALTYTSMNAILESEPVFPGLWAQSIQPRNELAYHDYVTWGGGTDSFLEYLVKYPLMIGNASHPYIDVYKQAVRSTMKHLLHKTSVGNLTFLGDWSEYNGHGPIYVHSHLACFSGGNIAMAGRLFDEPEWTRVGLELAESCVKTYAMSSTGIGPIAWGWFDKDGYARGWEYTSAGQRAFYNRNGVFFSSTPWFNQPEVIESVFHAWRITRQEFWRDLAWQAFQQVQLYCDSRRGWTGLTNVNDVTSAVYDDQQSFLFAELFKYLYLIFDDPQHYSLDEFVFNTEAHPFRRKFDGRFGKIQADAFPYSRLTSSEEDDVRVPERPDERLGSNTMASPWQSGMPPSSSSSKIISHGKGWDAWANDATHTATKVTYSPVHHQSTDGRSARVFTSALTGLRGCSMEQKGLQRLYCQWTPTILFWPFAFVFFYRFTLTLVRLMNVFERSLYRRHVTGPLSIEQRQVEMGV